jgi:hypothetical protein
MRQSRLNGVEEIPLGTHTIRTKIEVVANLITIVAGILLSVAVAKVYLLPAAARTGSSISPTKLAVGVNLGKELPDINFKNNGQTVTLALSTKCHFCTESAPFFRKLYRESAKGSKILAVFPESLNESKQYLVEKDVPVDQIKQIAIASIGVTGTPTMLQVDSKGTVKQVWMGRLSEPEQESALTSLRNSARAQ